MTSSTEILVGLFMTMMSLGASFWAWSIRRWITQVDARFETVQRDVSELKTRGAVSEERMANLMGAIDLLRESVSATDKSIGVVSVAVHKLWAVLEAKDLIEGRYSDEVLKTSRRG